MFVPKQTIILGREIILPVFIISLIKLIDFQNCSW